MLSDAERRRLMEIEGRMRSDDPEFADRFSHVLRRGPRTWRIMTTRRWLIAATLVMALAVLMASPAVALIASMVGGVTAGLWVRDYHRSADGRPRSRKADG
jgi:hypothetical protein